MKNPGRYLMQNDLFILDVQGMTSIGSPLETGYQIVAGRKIVHYLSFSFIAPLEA
jgi:hypothetical protein